MGVSILGFGAACTYLSEPSTSLDASDFDSIQAALDALPVGGGLVRIPAGMYYISQPLRICGSNVTLQGEGRATVIINENREGEPAILAGPEEDPKNNPLWGVTISNLCISGDSSVVDGAGPWPEDGHPDGAGGDAIRAEYCYNSLFEKLWLVRNTGNGLNLVICYEDPRIQSCIITYNGKAGVRLEGCHDIVVAANQLEENYKEGILAIGCYNLTASGNNIDDHRGSGMVLIKTTCSSLSGNLIEESRGWGLVVQDSNTNTFSAGTIRNNVPGGGVKFANSSFNTITGCSFEANDREAVYVNSNSRQNNISGNTFSTERYEEATASSIGLYIAGRENLVSANIISPKAGYGIRVSGSYQNVFGNTIISPGGGPNIVLDGLENSIVRDNLLLNRTQRILQSSILKRGVNANNRLEDNHQVR
jgi:parallel beta-helix repeat protein